MLAHSSGNSTRTVYLNAANNATVTGTRTPTGLNRTTIIPTSTNAATLDGADVAIWNVVLNIEEIESLAKGFKPHRIRPQSLVFYAPLVRELQDIKGGVTITNNGPTVTDHPRVY
jgi:hypothetical protein